MITISRKLFCLILFGLATLAVASICSILQLPISQAVMAFVGTWLALIALFEIGNYLNSDFPQGPTELK